MNGNDFAALSSAAETDTESLKQLMKMALEDGFTARLARKALNNIGIQVETNDSPAKAARFC